MQGCGLRKVWLDPNEVNDISMANSREWVPPPGHVVGPIITADRIEVWNSGEGPLAPPIV